VQYKLYNYIYVHLAGCCRENFASYGTMLEVRDVQYYADGRALVDAVGGRRFHVLSRGQKDGYRTARVEFLHDQPDVPSVVGGTQGSE